MTVKWLFGERFCLETKLKPDFVMGILRDHVGKVHRRPGDGVVDECPLFDKLIMKEEGRFVLWPSTKLFNRNSFRPVWRCELEGDGGGSRLRVRAGSPGALLFFVILFGFLGRWGGSALQGRAPWGWFPGVLGFSALFLLLSLLGFWLPERDAKAALQRILGGTFIDSK